MATSPIGSLSSFTWTGVLHDEAVFGGNGNQWMEGVTVGGPGLVAVGSDSGLRGRASAAVWTSADGTTWDRVPHDEAVFGGSEEISMLSVTAGGPGLVAVGYEGFRFRDPGSRAAVWTSIDGRTWSRVPNNEAVFGGKSMLSVTAGGPGLVAVGADGSGAAVWTSVDGLTWSRVAQDTAIFGCPDGQGFGMTGVTVGGPGLVAVGLADCVGTSVWTSADGLTWSRVPDSTGLDGFLLWGVTAGGPGLVAVGVVESDGGNESDAAVWTSVDGISWSRVPHDEAVFGGQGDLSASMFSVTSTGQGLIGVGGDSGTGSGPSGSNRHKPGASPWSSASAAVWTSPDGVSWSRISHDDAIFGEADGRWTGITSVINFGPDVVAVGADRTTDVDATAWVATMTE